MKIKLLTTADYESWDKFCAESDDAWFWHTSMWIRYTSLYRPRYLPDLKPENKSFMVMDGGKILAVCPLFVETVYGIREFSMGSMPLPVPALADNLNQTEKATVLKYIFTHIDELAKEQGVARSKFQYSPLSNAYTSRNFYAFNNLLKFGYLDSSIHTQIMILSEGLAKLRHGHDAAASAGAKQFTAQIFDSENITEDIFQKYVNFHEQAGGGNVRSKETYDIMYEALQSGQAFLAAALQNNEAAGFIFCYVYKDNAYYASTGIAAEFAKLPVAHFLQWAAIKHMKSENFRFYELGWQFFAPSIFYPDASKDMGISKFKRGFGGSAVPLTRGEKYYDAKLLKKVMTANIETLCRII